VHVPVETMEAVMRLLLDDRPIALQSYGSDAYAATLKAILDVRAEELIPAHLVEHHMASGEPLKVSFYTYVLEDGFNDSGKIFNAQRTELDLSGGRIGEHLSSKQRFSRRSVGYLICPCQSVGAPTPHVCTQCGSSL
jgi:hypothetical protein